LITIGFSPHRAEVLPFMVRAMSRHQVIVLENPPDLNFTPMLNGEMSIENYLTESDSGFPEFERLMCRSLQKLHKQGKEILQIEPFLERLLEIHEHFAAGKTPEEVQKLPELNPVYRAEKKATGALITYYRHSIQTDFSNLIASVKAFAKADAERSNLRSMLRARAIASLDTTREIFVESGYIHYPLYRYLRRKLNGHSKIRVVYLLHDVFRKLGCQRRNMGPGDILSLYYALNSTIKKDLADLLAARSLIYIKLIQKQEMIPHGSEAPHSQDEATANGLVDRLGFEDCKVIYPRIRFKPRDQALEAVTTFLKQKDKTSIEGR
jgi:hypothetical protein